MGRQHTVPKALMSPTLERGQSRLQRGHDVVRLTSTRDSVKSSPCPKGCTQLQILYHCRYA